jgi:alpha-amylase
MLCRGLHAPLVLAFTAGMLCACAADHAARASHATVVDAGIEAAVGSSPANKAVGGVFVQLFEWTWPDVARECREFLGPKGFAAVQVSPPSEHAILGGFPWWQRYQTVGYELDRSRSGTKAEFVDMVDTCAAAGVDVYVDAVINHTTAQANGTGSNGTSFQKYAYPGLYTANDFHQPPCQIMPSDYTTSALHVQTCELDGLADLNTGADDVRTTLANYLIALIEIGVRGFRIDAAKHISPTDLDAILTKVADGAKAFPTPYYFFEVIDPGGEAVQPTDYFAVGAARGVVPSFAEFKYAGMDDRFLNNAGLTLANLKDFGSPAWGLLPGGRAVVFTNNHDTQRATAIFYQDAPYFDLANIFMLAWPYGYPSIMSGYAFDRSTQHGRDQGPPSDAQGHTTSVYAADAGVPSCASVPASAAVGTWTCEHRVRSAANMVAFRKATASATTVTDWWDDQSNQIAFGRGDRGFVIINRENAVLARRFQTHLKAGRYCDIAGGDFRGGTCTGTVVAIDTSGAADITVPAYGAVAIHAEAMLP